MVFWSAAVRAAVERYCKHIRLLLVAAALC